MEPEKPVIVWRNIANNFFLPLMYMPKSKKDKKDKKVKIKNKNKNQIHITINSHNKRRVTSRPSQQPPQGHSSIFVSTPNQPYMPQNDSLFHLYPILENLKDKIDKINHRQADTESLRNQDEVIYVPNPNVKKEVIDISSHNDTASFPSDLYSSNYSVSSKPFDVNDSILNYGMKETKKQLAKSLDRISGDSLNYTRTSPYSSVNSQQNSLHNSIHSSVSRFSSDTESMPSQLTPVARRTRQHKSDISNHSHVPKYAPGSKKYKEYLANQK